MVFRDLCNRSDDIRYHDLLKTDEWLQYKDHILLRDFDTCTECGFKRSYLYYDEFRNGSNSSNVEKVNDDFIPPSLNVHHLYYTVEWLKNDWVKLLPWDYPDIALTTLCNYCHNNWHIYNLTPIFVKTKNNRVRQLTGNKCDKCNGTGYLKHYDYWENGICFKCDGTGITQLKGLKKWKID